MMTEAQTIANKLGITFRVPIEKRIAGAERVGHHKTSMLQDVEARRTLEIDALLGSVVELARIDRHADPAPRYGVRADQASGEEPGEAGRLDARQGLDAPRAPRIVLLGSVSFSVNARRRGPLS